MRAFSDEFLDGYLDEAGPIVTASVGGYQLEKAGVQLFERIEGDHFVVVENDGLGVAGERLWSFAAPAIYVDDQALVGCEHERRDVAGVERLRLASPGAPHGEEVAEREGAVGRRLDMDDPRLAAMHVEPVVAEASTADVGRDADRPPLVEDLERRVVVDLRVFELVTWNRVDRALAAGRSLDDRRCLAGEARHSHIAQRGDDHQDHRADTGDQPDERAGGQATACRLCCAGGDPGLARPPPPPIRRRCRLPAGAVPPPVSIRREGGRALNLARWLCHPRRLPDGPRDPLYMWRL